MYIYYYTKTIFESVGAHYLSIFPSRNLHSFWKVKLFEKTLG